MNKPLVLIIFIGIAFSFSAVTLLGSTFIASDLPKESSSISPVTPAYSPQMSAEVAVGDEIYRFDPTEVKTVRPDIFNPGFFSMFDVLVHLDSTGVIDLKYHFDDSMNTHVIDSIDEEPDWWYVAYYDGGWYESNIFRMDHYPWKEGSTLMIMQVTPSSLEEKYEVFREEIVRRKDDGGRLVIPQVFLTGASFSLQFENVEVTPHNMRSDIFKENVTTALDVIMSLGDQGEITYELQWYESIGTARIVRDYFVEAINEDKSFMRCGFVYESGPLLPKRFFENHIHIPSDTRVLNSPDYVEFFWICI